MAWRIELSALGQKNLRKLDPESRARILDFLDKRLAILENPRSLGAALTGSRLGTFWKYRIGDYRVIADIQDDVMRILVVRIGNRREVYR
ncbi:MAG: type II toxin-antitoxin system RelE/ParE family toxin [Rhodanobacter sp.]